MRSAIALFLIVTGTVACTSEDNIPPPAPGSPLTTLDYDFPTCEAVCSLLRSAAFCWEGETQPLCEAEYLCEAVCEDNPYNMVCIQVSPIETYCCETFYGCWDDVEPSCPYEC